MKPRAYKFETLVFAGVPVVRCCDTHYHSDCADPLSSALHGARVSATVGTVVLDMSSVRLFSSSALRAVRAAHIRAVESDGQIVAAGGGELAVNVLKFAPFIRHFETVPEALAHVSSDAARAYSQAEG